MLELFQSLRAREEVERIKPIWDVLSDYIMYLSLVISAITTLWQYDLESMILCVATPIDIDSQGRMSNQTNHNNACLSSQLQMVNVLAQTKLMDQGRMSKLFLNCKLMALVLVLESALFLLLNNFWYRLPSVVAKSEALLRILLKLEDIEDKEGGHDALEVAGKLISLARSQQNKDLPRNSKGDESSDNCSRDCRDQQTQAASADSSHGQKSTGDPNECSVNISLGKHTTRDAAAQGGHQPIVENTEGKIYFLGEGKGGTPLGSDSDKTPLEYDEAASADSSHGQKSTSDSDQCNSGFSLDDDTTLSNESAETSDEGTSPLISDKTKIEGNEEQETSKSNGPKGQSGAREQSISDLHRELMSKLPMIELTSLQKLMEVNRSVQGLKKSMNGNRHSWYRKLIIGRLILNAIVVGFNVWLIYCIGEAKSKMKYDFPDDFRSEKCSIECSLAVRDLLVGIYISVTVLFGLLPFFSFWSITRVCCWSCFICRSKSDMDRHRVECKFADEFSFFWYLFQRRKPCDLNFVNMSWANEERSQDQTDIHKEVERIVRTNMHYCKEDLLTCVNDKGTDVYTIDAAKCGLPSSLFFHKVDSVNWRLEIVRLDQLTKADFAGFDSFKNLVGLEISGCHQIGLPNLRLSSLKSLNMIDVHTRSLVGNPNAIYIQVPQLKCFSLNHVRPLSSISLSIETLTTLQIQNTTIDEFDFIKMPSIKDFSFDKVSFKHAPWSRKTGLLSFLNKAKKLKFLAVTNSDVKELPVLESKSLKRIDLSYNRLKIKIEDKRLEKRLEKLEARSWTFLDLRNNKIDTLGELLLKKIGSKCEIELTGNPLTDQMLSSISVQFALTTSLDKAKDCLELKEWRGRDIEATVVDVPSFRPKSKPNAVVVYYCDIVHVETRRQIMLYLACLCQLFYQGRDGSTDSSYNVYSANEFTLNTDDNIPKIDESKVYKDIKVFMGLRGYEKTYKTVNELVEKLKKMTTENRKINIYWDMESTSKMTGDVYKAVKKGLTGGISEFDVYANTLNVYPNIDFSSLLKLKALDFKKTPQN